MPPNPPSESKEPLVYVCHELSCPIRYSGSGGYFIDSGDKEAIDREIRPRVLCAWYGHPIYLGKVQAEIRSFRLWKCPECDESRTNEGPTDDLGKEMGA